jgi:anti-anti-sigma factor
MNEELWLKELQTRPPVAVIEAGGRLNSQGARDLHMRCEALYDAGCSQVIFRMAEVTFIASSGAGTLVKLTYDFLERGGLFQLADVSEPVMRVIDLLNSRQFLNFAPGVEEALENIETLNTTE